MRSLGLFGVLMAFGHSVLAMSGEESLAQVNREIEQLLLPRFRERLTDPSTRPADAMPVEMLVISYPMQHPGTPDDAPDAGTPDGAPDPGTPS